jgi:hypothetical protein
VEAGRSASSKEEHAQPRQQKYKERQISALIVFSGLSRAVLFTGAGLYHQHSLLRLALLLLPCVPGGLYIGTICTSACRASESSS